MTHRNAIRCAILIVSFLFSGTMTAAVSLAGTTRAETLSCTPALPFFCRNIHVQCAGRTTVEAPSFRIDFNGDSALIEFSDGTRWTASVAGYDQAGVVRPAAGRDWIRLQNDLSFVHRRYIRGTGAMSRGHCRSVER